MDTVGIKLANRIRIRGEVADRGAGNNSECLAGAHLLLQFDWFGVDGVTLVATGEAIAPLRLCLEIEFGRSVPLDGLCKPEQIIGMALFQFQFQFFNRRCTLSGDQLAAIHDKFNFACFHPDRQGDAMNRRFENWF